VDGAQRGLQRQTAPRHQVEAEAVRLEGELCPNRLQRLRFEIKRHDMPMGHRRRVAVGCCASRRLQPLKDFRVPTVSSGKALLEVGELLQQIGSKIFKERRDRLASSVKDPK